MNVRVAAEKMKDDLSIQQGRSSMKKRARILLVDDDFSIRKILSMILTQEGYVVDTAETAEQAVIKSDTSFYHLALIDFRLPDVEGTKLLNLLRVTVPRMRKVIMTGYPMVDNAVEAINRGIDGYLTKPVKKDQLLKLIEQLLEKQSMEKELFEQKMVQYLNSRFDHERAIQQEKESRLRLRVGDCEIPARLLLYVFVSIGSSPVSFGGVAYGEEGEGLREKLRLLSGQIELLYDAVDENGVESKGLCKIEGLKFDETPTVPVRIRFSGQLSDPYS
jgi:DNA-binding response OmpR family regulator